LVESKVKPLESKRAVFGAACAGPLWGIGVLLVCAAVGLCLWPVKDLMAVEPPKVDVGLVDAAETQDSIAPEGKLEPPSSEEERAARLEALLKGVKAAESRDTDRDCGFAIANRCSESAYDIVLASLASSHNGQAFRPPDREKFLNPPKRQTRWVFSRGRMRYESRLVPQQRSRWENFDVAYDGTGSQIYYPDLGAGGIRLGIHPTLEHIEEPRLTLSTVRIGGPPISETLQQPGAKYEGRQNIGGIRCEKVSVRDEPVLIELWISPDYGFRVKRMKTTQDLKLSQKPVKGHYQYGVSEVESFSRMPDGAWFPARGRTIVWRELETGEKLWLETTEWAATCRPVDSSEAFKIKFPPGTKVDVWTGGEPQQFIAGE